MPRRRRCMNRPRSGCPYRSEFCGVAPSRPEKTATTASLVSAKSTTPDRASVCPKDSASLSKCPLLVRTELWALAPEHDVELVGFERHLLDVALAPVDGEFLFICSTLRHAKHAGIQDKSDDVAGWHEVAHKSKAVPVLLQSSDHLGWLRRALDKLTTRDLDFTR